MKNCLSILLAFLALNNFSLAQNEISIEPNSFEESFEENLGNNTIFQLKASIENNTDTFLSTGWEIVDIDIPTEWSLSVSDKIIDYVPGITQNVQAVVLDPNETEVPFNVTIYPDQTNGCGTFNAIITKWDDGAFLDSIQYEVGINEEGCILSSISKITHLPSVNIYPNPVHDVLVIDAQSPIKQVSIYTLDGRKILSKSISPQMKPSIQSSTLEAGVHLLEIVFTDGSKNFEKIVKAH